MLVVADSSPLNFIIRLGHADSLGKLFQSVTGTIGVLERAAEKGFVDLPEAFEQLKRQPDFWIDQNLLDQRLDLFLRRR